MLKYDSDAGAPHLTNAFWYLDNGELLPCDPTAADAKTKVSSCDGTVSSRAKKSNSTAGYTASSVTYRYI